MEKERNLHLEFNRVGNPIDQWLRKISLPAN